MSVTMLNQNLARAFREKIGGDDLQINDIIKDTKISRSTLYHILHDDNYNPRFDNVEKLARYLNVSIDRYINTKAN